MTDPSNEKDDPRSKGEQTRRSIENELETRESRRRLFLSRSLVLSFSHAYYTRIHVAIIRKQTPSGHSGQDSKIRQEQWRGNESCQRVRGSFKRRNTEAPSRKGSSRWTHGVRAIEQESLYRIHKTGPSFIHHLFLVYPSAFPSLGPPSCKISPPRRQMYARRTRARPFSLSDPVGPRVARIKKDCLTIRRGSNIALEGALVHCSSERATDRPNDRPASRKPLSLF